MSQTLSQLSALQLRQRLHRGLGLRLGPFSISLQGRPSLLTGLTTVYADYPLLDEGAFIDYPIRIKSPGGLRRWWRPQVQFEFDGRQPFKPLPASQGLAFFEWGLNWVIAQHAHQFLILHAAVLAHGDRALILPGPPGAGKSTLCAALMLSGWRLLSDEMALIDLSTGQLLPVVRPVSLKNESIDIIRQRFSEAVLGPPALDTAKGTVAHLKPKREDIQAMAQPATPRWLVFPRYQSGAATHLTAHGKGQGFLYLAENAFNYSVHGSEGFHALGAMMQHCDCFDFRYSDLDQAIARFDELAREDARAAGR